MFRLKAGVLALALLLLGLAMHAAAAPTEGSRLAISIFSSGAGEEGGSDQVITTDPSGGDSQKLFGGSGELIGPGLSWSADGNWLAFSAPGAKSTASGPFGTGWPVAAVVRADGSGLRVFSRAFLNGGEPVMAPDGRSLLFQRLKLVKELPGRENNLLKSALWSLDVKDGSVRRLSRWRLASFLNPVSFSADGLTLSISMATFVPPSPATLSNRPTRPTGPGWLSCASGMPAGTSCRKGRSAN
jgi:hypothetical protein